MRACLKGDDQMTTQHLLNTEFGTETIATATMTKVEFEKLYEAYADTKRVVVAKKVTLAMRQGSLGFDIVDHYDVTD